MRKYRSLLAVASVVALALPVFAGHEGEKCSSDTQACLNYMADHMKNSAYIGVELDWDDEGGPTVNEVKANSPAQAAGLKVGDRLVNLNGTEFSDKDAVHAIWKDLKAGDYAKLKVERNGAVRKLSVTLAAMPDDAIAQYVGKHMLEHAVVDIAQD